MHVYISLLLLALDLVFSVFVIIQTAGLQSKLCFYKWTPQKNIYIK